jgi:hypothetical protein
MEFCLTQKDLPIRPQIAPLCPSTWALPGWNSQARKPLRLWDPIRSVTELTTGHDGVVGQMIVDGHAWNAMGHAPSVKA